MPPVSYENTSMEKYVTVKGPLLYLMPQLRARVPTSMPHASIERCARVGKRQGASG